MEQILTFGFGVIITLLCLGLIYFLRRINQIEKEVEENVQKIITLTKDMDDFIDATEEQVKQIYTDLETLLTKQKDEG